MTFDPSSYVPEPNEWLDLPTEHRGRAKLRFRDPAGSVEGDAELSFDETGEVRIEVRLDPATLEVESGTGEGLLPFIQPDRSKVVDGRRISIHSFGDELNACSRLEIETHEGLLATEDVDDYSHQVIIGGGRDELRLVFEPHFVSAFDVVGAGQPKYWALPLLNFVSRFPQKSPTTDRHPLRVYPTPVVSDNLPEEEREAAVDAANEHNRLILFEFAGRPGFVERLVGYEEREEALRQGRTRSAATAVVVGEIGDRDPQYLENSFPSDVAALLSLASGTEVSAPSIEFRDEEGRLVRRVHYHLSPSPYLEGHRPIRDRLALARSRRGTGLLLTKATSSAENGFGEAYLRVAIRHLVRAGSDARTIDEQVAYLCRCLDSLCKRFEVDRQNLRAGLTIQELEDVTNALDVASGVIRPLADNARASGRADDLHMIR